MLQNWILFCLAFLACHILMRMAIWAWKVCIVLIYSVLYFPVKFVYLNDKVLCFFPLGPLKVSGCQEYFYRPQAGLVSPTSDRGSVLGFEKRY